MTDSPEAEEEPTGVRVTSHAEMLYLSAIRLLSERIGAVRPEAATGFVVVNEGGERFLVTARHAIESVACTTLFLYTGDSVHTIGSPLAYEIRAADSFWTFHPDPSVDVAVGRFEPISDFFAKLDEQFIVGATKTTDFHRQPPIGVGGFTDKFWHPLPLDEVLIVGYPRDYRDIPTSLPILRRGRIATPLWLDHEGRPVFVVDSAADRGSSGGPVAYVEEEHKVGKYMCEGTGKVVLLGIFSERFPPRAHAVSVTEGEPLRPPNLGAVYKAHTILETMSALQ
ncbi:MAG TPA: trypsin-like peptidase domain-containing protein [Thermoanaerobaculia bacterium]|jgi:hypothetical protein|nr:trypsin-like peptidase domain-containing protein [Thermoanaerobaculia bacterium]